MNQMTKMNQKMNMNHVINLFQMMNMSQITHMNWMRNMEECNMPSEYQSQLPRLGVLVFLQQQAKPWQTWFSWINWAWPEEGHALLLCLKDLAFDFAWKAGTFPALVISDLLELQFNCVLKAQPAERAVLARSK